MNPLVKKILIALGIILVIGAIIFMLFFYKGTLVFNPNPSTARIEVNGTSITGSGKIKLNPGNYNIKITAAGYVDYLKNINIEMTKSTFLNITLKKLPEPQEISQGTAQFLTAGEDTSGLFYLGNNGRTAYRMTNAETADTRKIDAITPDIFEKLKFLGFSPNQLLAVYKKEMGTYLYDFNRYDLLHQEIRDLGSDIGYIIWSPDNEKILYYFQTKEGEKTLIRANKDNTNQERIFNFKDTGIANPALDWSKDSQKILVIKNDIYIFDIYTKTLSPVTKGGGITEAKFSPDSQNIIFNKVDENQNTTLNLTDLNGSNIRELSIKTTLNKIVWLDNKNLIAALPDLADSNASDKLLKLNIDTFEETEFKYGSTIGKISIISPVLLAGKNKLFFLSNNSIYELELISTEY